MSLRIIKIVTIFLLISEIKTFGRINKIDKNTKEGNYIENKGQFLSYSKFQPELKFVYQQEDFNLLLTENGFSYEVIQTTDLPDDNLKSSVNQNSELSNDEKKKWKIKGHRVDVNLIGAVKNIEIIKEGESKDYINYFIIGNSRESFLGVRNYQKITYRNIYPKVDLVFTVKENSPKYDFVLWPGANINDIKLQYIGADKVTLDESNNVIISTSVRSIIEKIPFSFQYSINNDSIEEIKVRYVLSGNEVSFKAERYDRTKKLIIDPIPGIIWSTYSGGSESDGLHGIAIDKNNSSIVYGHTRSYVGIATPGAFDETQSGGIYGSPYFAKYDSNGVRLWASYYVTDGFGSTYIRGITVDNNNNFYLTGLTSADGMATPGSLLEHPPSISGDAFLAKFNPNGNLIWGTYYGGIPPDNGVGVAVDLNNNVIICGSTRSLSGISTAGAYQPTLHGDGSVTGGTDCFIAKFDPLGNRLWGTYYGGRKDDLGMDMACDSKNNILVFGYTKSLDSISTIGAFQANFGGGANDNFVLKLTSGGNVLWSTYYGGSKDEGGSSGGIEVDGNDNIIIAQATSSTDNITSAGAYQTNLNLGANTVYTDNYIAKFDSTGVRLWGTYYGGAAMDFAGGIDIDKYDNIYLTGATYSPTAIATPNAHKTIGTFTVFDKEDFLCKFSLSGNLIWGSYFGGTENEDAGDIEIDHSNNILICGFTESSSEISVPGSFDVSYNGASYYGDGFLSKFSQYCTSDSVQIYPTTNLSFCPNDSLLLHSTFIGTNLWSNGMISDSVYVKSPGSYFVAARDSSGCLSFSDVVTVSLQAIPSLTIQPSGPIEFCQGDSVILVATTNQSYLWSDGSTNNSIVAKQTGNYSVIVSDANNCKNSAYMNITANPLPSPIISVSDTVLCEGETATLTSPLFFAYQWSNGLVSNAITVDQSGYYFVTVTDSKGCKDTSNTLHFTFNPMPVSSGFSKDTTLCQGDVLTLYTKNLGASYLWSDGSTEDSLVLNSSGLYWVEVSLGDCRLKDSISVNHVLPLEFSLGNDTSVCIKNGFTISTGIKEPTANFSWSNGEKSPTTFVNSPGIYSVAVTYYSCPIKIDSIIVNDLGETKYFIPNLITDNGDGKNDYFVINNILPNTTIYIYNRWGDLVYQEKEYKNEWQGNGLNPDVYYFYLMNEKYSCVGEYKGWVQIVR